MNCHFFVIVRALRGREPLPSCPSVRLQGSAKKRSPGLVNFVPALAYHLCLALPAAFTQPGDHFLAEPCPQRCVDAHNARMLARTPDGRRKSQNEFLFGRRGALLNRIFFHHRGFT